MKSELPNLPDRENIAQPTGGDLPTATNGSHNGWPWRKILALVVLALVVHVGLILFFGTKKQITPRKVKNVPHLQLAGDENALIAFANPTLLTLPNAHDFSSALWLKMPDIKPPIFRWNESPQWLPFNAQNSSLAFHELLPANTIAQVKLDIKPLPEFSSSSLTADDAMPENSTLKILGALAQRLLSAPINLPSLSYDNVIPPSRIQVLVDNTGNVISAILLPLTDASEASERYDPADQQALVVARNLHFTPARQLTFGEIIFHWHTLPTVISQTSTTH